MKRYLLFASFVTAALAAGCRNDPVQQQLIDSLGPETGTPSATHRPGQPCLACHTAYGGATPEFAVAGTIYALDATGKHIVPAKNILVQLLDSQAEDTRKACTNDAGNFMVTKDDWPTIAFPVSPTAGGQPMQSLIGRDGSCATCHRLPDAANCSTPPNVCYGTLDPLTGKGRESAGVITVAATATDPTCTGGQ